MKQKQRLFQIFCILSHCLISPLWADGYRFDMWLDNIEQHSEHEFRFDVFLQNTGEQCFIIEDYAFGVDYAPSLLNGGAFNLLYLEYVDDSSDFEPGPANPNYPKSDGFYVLDNGTGNLVFNSAVAIPGSTLTLINPGESIKTGTFKVSLRNQPEMSGLPHKLGCGFPAIELVEAHCQVRRADNCSEVIATNDPAGIIITTKNILPTDHSRQFAGYWFSGEGSWHDPAYWNQTLKAENHDYQQQIPQPNNNVVIHGHATISSGHTVTLESIANTGGQIQIANPGNHLYSLELIANGTSVEIALFDNNFVSLDNPQFNIEAGTVLNFYCVGSGSSGDFINWTDQYGQVVGVEESQYSYIMPAQDMVITANWSSGTKSGLDKHQKEAEIHASLTIAPGGALRAESILTDYPDEVAHQALIIQSDGVESGSLIHKNPGVRASMQHHIPGETQAWHLLTMPVTAMPIEGSAFMPGQADDFYLWDESGTWVNIKHPDNSLPNPRFLDANSGDHFVEGRGYLVAYQPGAPVRNFNGTLFSGDLPLILEKSSEKNWIYKPGWNLLGNPYASYLDLESLDVSNILEENYFYVYDPFKDGGEGYVTTSVIAPLQGFFVKAANDQVTLPLSHTNQTHANGAPENKQGAMADKLVIRLSNDAWYDEAVIGIHEEASLSHNFYNASKLFSFNPDIPQISTLTSDGRQVAINSIPEIPANLQVPVSVKVPANGPMSLSIQQTSGLFEQYSISLHDMKTGVDLPLPEGGEYAFEADTADNPLRFKLHFFDATTSGQHPEETMDAHIWAHGNALYVQNPDTEALLHVYTPSGQLIRKAWLKHGRKRILLKNHTGPVVVELITTDSHITTTAIIH